MRTETALPIAPRNATRHIFVGLLTVAAGMFILAHPVAESGLRAPIRSALFLLAIAQLAFGFNARAARGYLRELLVVAYAAAGVTLFALPVPGLVTVTFVLGVALLAQAALRAAIAVTRPVPTSFARALVSAGCSLLLGFLTLAGWPSAK